MASNGHFWALDIGSYHRSYCRFTSSGATNNTSSIVTTTFRILEHNAPRMHSLQPEKKWSVCLGFQLKHRGAVEIHTRQKNKTKKPSQDAVPEHIDVVFRNSVCWGGNWLS